MTYNFIYSTEPKRIISAVILDARFTIPSLTGLGGFEVKSYVDNEINKVTSDVLPYKLETENGNFVGYISLKITNMGNSATKFQQFLRPAYQIFANDIENVVNLFINNNIWKPDYLI